MNLSKLWKYFEYWKFLFLTKNATWVLDWESGIIWTVQERWEWTVLEVDVCAQPNSPLKLKGQTGQL